ncbi:cysteine desulfurase family protein, partial [Leucobacter chromiireducens]|uniref:cysteine desulfurase family protein n=1 Tax=Leucobacter chromiireducens TaxID=283877 RepID=UPI000F63B974
VQPIQEIAAAARARGVLVHTDAVQAAATLPVSFSDRGIVDAESLGRAAPWPGDAVDALTIASHKFGGPQGVGALLVRTRLPLEPLLHGGGQERGLRSGTENVAGIAGFGAAVAAVHAQIGQRALALMRCRDALIDAVLAGVPGACLTGDPDERLPGHASFTVAGVSGESLLVALDAAGLAVSSGSACAAGRSDPSPALLAMGIDPDTAQSALRFTLPGEISDAVIARLVSVMSAEVARAGALRRARGGSAPR